MYETMLTCNNYFERTSEYGDYTVLNNSIATCRGIYYTGQYVRIIGSLFNDGVYKITALSNGTITLDGTLQDEAFNGYIVGLAVPNDFIALSAKVEANGIDPYKKELSLYRKPYISKMYFLNSVIVYD